jgi:hypothetical protein
LAITLRWWDAAAVAPLLDGHTALIAFPDVLRRLHIVPLDDAAARRGLAGEEVLPVDREFLQLTPTRRFLVGEVVAFEDTQRVWRYAVVKHDNRDRVDAIGTLQVRTTLLHTFFYPDSLSRLFDLTGAFSLFYCRRCNAVRKMRL